MPSHQNLEKLRQAQATKLSIEGSNQVATQAKIIWTEPPGDLPPPLPSAPSMIPDMIPVPLRAWLQDNAERMQVSLEFVAAPAIVALSILIGRRLGIRPKAWDDWTVTPNLWGLIVARPGYMKSPALKAALKPFDRLVAQALKQRENGANERIAKINGAEAAIEGVRAKIKSDAKKGESDHSINEVQLMELCGTLRDLKKESAIYYTNDATIEKLVMLLEGRPSGMLVLRDEIAAWLKMLDKPGHEADRAFNLESWNGDGRHIVHRVSRESNHVEGLCLSILGGIQPGRLSEYIQSAVSMGSGDDGLIQRFQLAVFPDESPHWENVDRYANKAAKNEAFAIFQALDVLDFASAARESEDGNPYVHFDLQGQELFNAWLSDLEKRLRSQKSSFPAFESHLAKYRSLLPSIALIFQAIDFAGGVTDTLSPNQSSVGRAIDWCDFLEAHAKKIYSIVLNPTHQAIRLLADKIRDGHIRDGMTVRELYRHHWRGLDTQEKVEPALIDLEKLNWLKVTESRGRLGRATEIIKLNPALIELPVRVKGERND